MGHPIFLVQQKLKISNCYSINLNKYINKSWKDKMWILYN